MIDLHIRKIGAMWFGLASTDEKIIATSVNSNRQKALKSLLFSLPKQVKYQILEKGSAFVENTMLSMEKAYLGQCEFTDFELADDYYSAPVIRVLKAAASISLGHIASYGDIARVAGTAAQSVGQIMAKNPLYPIVPCHRVVGADFSLVGYGGKRTSQALKAKLDRLVRECRGFQPKKIRIFGSEFLLKPVELVVERAKRQGFTVNLRNQQKLIDY